MPTASAERAPNRIVPSKRATGACVLCLVGAVALVLASRGIAFGQGAATKTSTPGLFASKSDWNVRDHVPLSEIVVQSHRGAGMLAPENTLTAFQLAWKLGTVPEADLRMTNDGVVVAFHDNDFRRLVKNADEELKKKGVADLDWAALRNLEIGEEKDGAFAGCRVPAADEIFELVAADPRRRVYLDIKQIDLEKLADKVKAAGIQSQVILASTDYALIRQWKALAPASGTLLWMGGDEPALAKRIEELRKTQFAGVTQLQIHVGSRKTPEGEKITPSEAFLIQTGKELRARGILFQTLPLGRSDAEIYWRLMDLGVASFATDFPDKTMAAIRKYYATTPR